EATHALGWPAPARRDGSRSRARAAGVPDGRAAVEPRCQAARRDARRDPAHPARSRGDDDLRHARSDGSDDHGRPRRGDAARSESTLTVVPEIREDMGPEVYIHFGLGVPPVRRTEVAEAQTADDEPAQPPLVSDRSPFVARLARGTRAAEREPLKLAVDVNRIYVFDAKSGEGRYAR